MAPLRQTEAAAEAATIAVAAQLVALGEVQAAQSTCKHLVFKLHPLRSSLRTAVAAVAAVSSWQGNLRRLAAMEVTDFFRLCLRQADCLQAWGAALVAPAAAWSNQQMAALLQMVVAVVGLLGVLSLHLLLL